MTYDDYYYYYIIIIIMTYIDQRRDARGVAMRSQCDRCVRAGHDL